MNPWRRLVEWWTCRRLAKAWDVSPDFIAELRTTRQPTLVIKADL